MPKFYTFELPKVFSPKKRKTRVGFEPKTGVLSSNPSGITCCNPYWTNKSALASVHQTGNNHFGSKYQLGRNRSPDRYLYQLPIFYHSPPKVHLLNPFIIFSLNNFLISFYFLFSAFSERKTSMYRRFF